eukprot:1449453-Rhodomonas_salina.1
MVGSAASIFGGRPGGARGSPTAAAAPRSPASAARPIVTHVSWKKKKKKEKTAERKSGNLRRVGEKQNEKKGRKGGVETSCIWRVCSAICCSRRMISSLPRARSCRASSSAAAPR